MKGEILSLINQYKEGHTKEETKTYLMVARDSILDKLRRKWDTLDSYRNNLDEVFKGMKEDYEVLVDKLIEENH